MTDAEIVTGLHEDDHAAQVAFVKRCWPVAMARARRYINDFHLCEDVASATISGLFLHLTRKQIDEVRSLGALTWRRARWEAICVLRRRGDQQDLTLPMDEELADDSTSPILVDDEFHALREALEYCLGHIKANKQREAARLVWAQGLTQTEAAKHLGLSQSAVSQRLENARPAYALCLAGRGCTP